MKHFVFNGRYGDIIHSLPAVWEYTQRTGETARMTVAAEFAHLIEGCSYIEGHAAQAPWVDINAITGQARRAFPNDDFCVMACYGKDYSSGYDCHSFLRQSWKLSGCPRPPETQPLVFDQRSKQREHELLANCGLNQNQKFILVSIAGKSSPFPHGQQLLADVKAARPDCQVIDLSAIKAQRVYDLLCLFEHAEALVTIDTMHLHLSAAVPTLPVFAFICNGPTRWNRSDWRPQQWWRCLYAEYQDRREQFKTALQSKTTSTPKIHHVWSSYQPSNPETQRRMADASASWAHEAAWAENWWFTGITKAETLRCMPADSELLYVHDILDHAAEGMAPNDIISFSNADVGCIRGITGYVLDACREHGCAFAHRWDADRINTPITTEHEIGANLRWYPGSDWFWMTAKWWREHKAEMPDMVIGREYWDCVLRQIMKRYGAREIAKSIWHEKHPSLWDRPGNRQTLPGNVHNRTLANRWFAENKSNDLDPYRNTWNMQPGTTRINPEQENRQSSRGVETLHNIVLPLRLEFYRRQPRRIIR
jgi:hypothetical protein